MFFLLFTHNFWPRLVCVYTPQNGLRLLLGGILQHDLPHNDPNYEHKDIGPGCDRFYVNVSGGQLFAAFSSYIMKSPWRLHVPVLAFLMISFFLHHTFCFPESQIWMMSQMHQRGESKDLNLNLTTPDKTPLIEKEDREEDDNSSHCVLLFPA